MTENTLPKPWQPQPDEPPEWSDRFHVYLMLGPSRTLAAAFRAWTNSDGSPSGTASKQAKEWRWQERALACDQANRAEWDRDLSESRERRPRFAPLPLIIATA